jgi:hypothetical protein
MRIDQIDARLLEIMAELRAMRAELATLREHASSTAAPSATVREALEILAETRESLRELDHDG